MLPEQRRKSTRLRGYDYRTPALYHIVACTQDKTCRFGSVHSGEIHLNDIGKMIDEAWLATPKTFPTVALDAWVVMPNHVHGILFISPPVNGSLTVTLGDIMKWFKTRTTVLYGQGVRTQGWPPYDRQFWQRNYYDHVVRSERDLDRIREYIANNPFNWDKDELFSL